MKKIIETDTKVLKVFPRFAAGHRFTVVFVNTNTVPAIPYASK
jgi:hypothetical protein